MHNKTQQQTNQERQKLGVISFTGTNHLLRSYTHYAKKPPAVQISPEVTKPAHIQKGGRDNPRRPEICNPANLTKVERQENGDK